MHNKQHICFTSSVKETSEQQDIIPYVVCYAGTHEGSGGTATITSEAIDACVANYDPEKNNSFIPLIIGHSKRDDTPRLGDCVSLECKEIEIDGATSKALIANMQLNELGKKTAQDGTYTHFSIDGSCTSNQLDLSAISLTNFPAAKDKVMSQFQLSAVASSDQGLQDAKRVIFSQQTEQRMPEEKSEIVKLSAKLETVEAEQVKLSAKLEKADKQVVALSAKNEKLEAIKVELSNKLEAAEKQVAELSQEKVIAQRKEILHKEQIVDEQAVNICLSAPTEEAFNNCITLCKKQVVAFASKSVIGDAVDAKNLPKDEIEPSEALNQHLEQIKQLTNK